eukprot:scaffold281051_cov15-Tisochrysis_lutea.AAC.1
MAGMPKTYDLHAKFEGGGAGSVRAARLELCLRRAKTRGSCTKKKDLQKMHTVSTGDHPTPPEKRNPKSRPYPTALN